MIKIGICLFVCQLSLCCGFELTILHTNDVHDRIEEFEGKNGGVCKPDKHKGDCYGGVSRRLTKINEIRAKDPNVILLDAGDQFMGTNWFSTYGGDAAAHFMNKLQYEAMTLGNHEFDRGIDGLEPFLKKVNFSVVCSNINVTNEPRLKGLIKESHVISFGNDKIGLVGYVLPQTTVLSDPGPTVSFIDEIKALKFQVAKLKENGVNKIIAMGHSGFSRDIEIANEVEGIDIIVGGHSNTFLYSGTPPSIEKPVEKYPHVVTQASGAEVLLVEDYTYGKYLGRLKTTWYRDGIVSAYSGNPILLNNSVNKDTTLEKDVQEWAIKVKELGDEKLGISRVLLNGHRETCRAMECNLGNLITDGLVQTFLGSYNESYWTDSGLAIQNAGGIRSSIEAGEVTRGDVMLLHPFRNTVVAMIVNGSILRSAFEYSVSEFNFKDLGGKFLQVSGFKVVIDLTKPDNNKIVSIKVRCSKCNVPVFEPLDDAKLYQIITNKFLAAGGDGYGMFKNNLKDYPLIDYGHIDADVIADYIKKIEPVVAGVEGRITVITSKTTPSPSNCITTPSRAGMSHLSSYSLISVVVFVIIYLH